MRKIKDTEINGRQITVNELTVEEVSNLLDNLGGSLIGMMFDGRMPMVIVTHAAGLKEDELKSWCPSDIDKLITEVETVNPHCARLCKFMVKSKVGPTPKSSDAAVDNYLSTGSVKNRGRWGYHSLWNWLRHGRK